MKEKMNFLIDGYEYLSSLSSQLPEALQQTARDHKKSLVDAMESIVPVDSQILQDHSRQIELLNNELKELTHARILSTVESRELLREVKTPVSRPILLSDVDDGFIHVPTYNPLRKQRNETQQSESRHHHLQLTARSTANSLMVPAMRQGNLPPELRNIKTSPANGVKAYPPDVRYTHFRFFFFMIYSLFLQFSFFSILKLVMF